MSDNPQQSQPQSQQVHQQNQSNNNQNQDLENCDLANLESLNVNDSDELLRQLTENTFELETFFSEFSTTDIKVKRIKIKIKVKNLKFINFLFRRKIIMMRIVYRYRRATKTNRIII